ncbi:MAG: gephyrin-like molybdotransferase Glp [Chloroflexota bacterium]
MLAVSVARQRVLDRFPVLEAQQTPLAECVGRVLAQDIHAAFPQPPFPNSGMDGFAVRSADVAGAAPGSPVRLRVVADIPAGQVAEAALQPGQAMRIMTGAPLPEGADAVSPVENTDFDLRQAGRPAPEWVSVLQPELPGSNVRPAGQDMQPGELVLRAGQRLRPQDVGLLSMMGVAVVPLRRRPRVAVFSSGDELLPADQPLRPGKIHDANTYTLTGLVEAAGAQALNLGIAADHPQAIQALLDQALDAQVDLVLSSAGVSVGALDFVRSVVEANGELAFWRVNMRPGKPVAFGRYRQTPFIGLPGNPVSAFVGFEVFVRPALLQMQGAAHLERPTWQAHLAEPVSSDGRETYLRAVVEKQGDTLVARLTGHQGSGNLRSLVDANALLFVPSGVKFLPSGSQVRVWLLDGELF